MSTIKESFLDNYSSWVNSFKTGLCQDKEGNYLPWMPYSLIKYLEKELKASDLVFEYGFGTSSIFFAKRVKKVISVESNKKWHEVMTEMVSEQGVCNIETVLMPDALENTKYENLVRNFSETTLPDPGFDWIVIDSLKRAKCTTNATLALKKGGKILLDDAQRLNYKKIYDFMIEKGFSCQEFEDIAPGQLKLKKAWIFTKK